MATRMEELRAQLGANIRESTAGRRATPAGEAPARRGPARDEGVGRDRDAREIAIGQVVPDPDQPRKHFGAAELEVMRDSLRARGQLQPIRVRWSESLEKWVIVAGERRYRGALMAGLDTLKAIVTEAAGDLDILSDQLVENIVREDLDPLEEAEALRRLLAGEGMSQHALAARLGISQGRIAQRLALLDLAPAAREAVVMGEIPASTAYRISRAPAADQEAIAREAIDRGLTRDEVQGRVDAAIDRAPADPDRPRRKSSRPGPAKAKGAGLATGRKFRTEGRFRIAVERAAPFDRPALHAALLEAAAVVAAEIEATPPA